MVVEMNLKEGLQKMLQERGADINNFRFRYSKKSRYQQNRYKPEFVGAECWIYPKPKKNGYLVTEDDFTHKGYMDDFIDMIIEDTLQ